MMITYRVLHYGGIRRLTCHAICWASYFTCKRSAIAAVLAKILRLHAIIVHKTKTLSVITIVRTVRLHCQPFLAWDVIYTSRAYATMSVSFVCPSVRLSVTEVHWRIIANLGFKFRSNLPRIAVAAHNAPVRAGSQCIQVHCGRGACREEGRGHLALC